MSLPIANFFILILFVNVYYISGQFAPLGPLNLGGSDMKKTYVSEIELLFEDFESFMPGSNTFAGKSFGEILSLFESHFHAIFPGTHWCGPGNDASDYNDLGLFNKTDNCCRAHDNCPSDILAGETLGPLINDGIFTRSACGCDNEFYQCLKNISSVIAKSIGETYFNILRPQCFAVEYPILSCAEYSGIIGSIKCIRYNVDPSKNKTLEWFDNANF